MLGLCIHLGLDTTNSAPACITSKGLSAVSNRASLCNCRQPATIPPLCAAWTEIKTASAACTTQEGKVSGLRYQMGSWAPLSSGNRHRCGCCVCPFTTGTCFSTCSTATPHSTPNHSVKCNSANIGYQITSLYVSTKLTKAPVLVSGDAQSGTSGRWCYLAGPFHKGRKHPRKCPSPTGWRRPRWLTRRLPAEGFGWMGKMPAVAAVVSWDGLRSWVLAQRWQRFALVSLTTAEKDQCWLFLQILILTISDLSINMLKSIQAYFLL